MCMASESTFQDPPALHRQAGPTISSIGQSGLTTAIRQCHRTEDRIGHLEPLAGAPWALSQICIVLAEAEICQRSLMVAASDF